MHLHVMTAAVRTLAELNTAMAEAAASFDGLRGSLLATDELQRFWPIAGGRRRPAQLRRRGARGRARVVKAGRTWRGYCRWGVDLGPASDFTVWAPVTRR